MAVREAAQGTPERFATRAHLAIDGDLTTSSTWMTRRVSNHGSHTQCLPLSRVRTRALACTRVHSRSRALVDVAHPQPRTGRSHSSHCCSAHILLVVEPPAFFSLWRVHCGVCVRVYCGVCVCVCACCSWVAGSLCAWKRTRPSASWPCTTGVTSGPPLSGPSKYGSAPPLATRPLRTRTAAALLHTTRRASRHHMCSGVVARAAAGVCAFRRGPCPRSTQFQRVSDASFPFWRHDLYGVARCALQVGFMHLWSIWMSLGVC
jgi:hypothetical protein